MAVDQFMRAQAALVAACKLPVAAGNAHEAQDQLLRNEPIGSSGG